MRDTLNDDTYYDEIDEALNHFDDVDIDDLSSDDILSYYIHFYKKLEGMITNKNSSLKRSTNIAPSSNKFAASPNKFAPSPNKFAPSPNKFAPSSNRFAPSSNRFAASPDKFAASSNKFAQSPNKFVPSPNKFAPSSNKIVPSSDKIAPSPNKIVPSSDKIAPSPNKFALTPNKITLIPNKISPSPNKFIVNTPNKINAFTSKDIPTKVLIHKAKSYTVQCNLNDIVEKVPLVLLDHQIIHADRLIGILNHSFWAIDNSVMGSGKTFTSSYVCKHFNFKNLIVVSPASVEGTWQDMEEIYDLPIATIGRETEYGKQKVSGIMSYNTFIGRDQGIIKNGLLYRTKIKVVTQGKAQKETEEIFYEGTPLLDSLIRENTFFLFDEAHKTKNGTTSTYKAVRVVINRIKEIYETEGTQSRVLLMTGTPFDVEVQVANFMKLVGITTKEKLYENIFGNFRIEGFGAEEIRNYCYSINSVETDKIMKEFPFKPKKESLEHSIFQLYNRIIQPYYVSTMTPPRIDVPLDVKNGYYKLSKERSIQLRHALNDLSDATGFNEPERQSGNFAEVMIAMGRIENIKLEIFIRKAIQTLESDPNCKVALIFNFTPSINIAAELLKQYNPVILNGKVPKKKRAMIVNNFNRHDLCNRLIIGNLIVCSLGINLHDTNGEYPRYAFVSPNFRAQDTHQVTYRFYRAGTKSTPHVREVYAKVGSDETRILDSYSRKTEVFKATLKTQVEHKILFPGEYIREDEPEDVPLINMAYTNKVAIADLGGFEDQPEYQQFNDDEEDELRSEKQTPVKGQGKTKSAPKPRVKNVKVSNATIPSNHINVPKISFTPSKFAEPISLINKFASINISSPYKTTSTNTSSNNNKLTLEDIWVNMSEEEINHILRDNGENENNDLTETGKRVIVSHILASENKLDEDDLDVVNNDNYDILTDYDMQSAFEELGF
jgi:hypothetical protein